MPLDLAEQTLRSLPWLQEVAAEFRGLLERLRKELVDGLGNGGGGR